ncbi:MAG TPA: YciI family protein [Spirochaetia bacterium]|nr:YciI family protein [Spirochaetia bacterium]
MKYFFLRLNPPRPTFSQDMTPEERGVMQRHVAYWTDLMGKGAVLVFGPVLDPRGTYGIGVIGVESESERDTFMANDPANGLLRYECHDMRAVVPGT